MELKKIFGIIIFTLTFNTLNAEMVKPSKNLSAYDVVKIQLDALKKNNKLNDGIKQTWLFAHPDNKKFTGPYERFKNMLLGQQYKILLNHLMFHLILSILKPIQCPHRFFLAI